MFVLNRKARLFSRWTIFMNFIYVFFHTSILFFLFFLYLEVFLQIILAILSTLILYVNHPRNLEAIINIFSAICFFTGNIKKNSKRLGNWKFPKLRTSEAVPVLYSITTSIFVQAMFGRDGPMFVYNFVKDVSFNKVFKT